jgi:15-cis-phytoene synthase
MADQLSDVVNHSKMTIERGSKSFARAAALMPADVRDSVYMLYAWCRYCDDCIDDQHLGFAQATVPGGLPIEERVAVLRQRTLAAYSGSPDGLEFEALARVADKHAIPERFPLDLIDGFAMDAAGHRYRTEEDTLKYCYHVAGAVGVMMAMVMGVRDQPTLLRACDLGMAFQLTNISRDVPADAQMGRVYLPEQWLAEHGLSAHSLDESRHRKAIFEVVQRVLALADSYYDSAGYGIARLPYRSAWSIASALRIYRAIGTTILERGPAAWDSRATTSKRQKLVHVALASGDAAFATSVGRFRKMPPRDHLWTPPALLEGDAGLAARRLIAAA